MVTVDYLVAPDNQAEFRAQMRHVRRTRRRTGAVRWELYRDGAVPDCFVEVFVVPTWGEHLRQHDERSTLDDRAALERAIALTSGGPPRVRHLFPPEDG
jgi:quinol monooxygenase YgiN